uniref:Uncharacterized protein n=1 Tax=Sinocyclocheilus grahami TaxID=75366 RepID=A0A672QY96_SINGR
MFCLLSWACKKDESCKRHTIVKLSYLKFSSTSCRFLKSPAAQEACDHLTKVLGTSPLLLTELDLSEDKLGDLDWEKLSLNVTFSFLSRLSECGITEEGYKSLASALRSNPSHLIELDLTGNDPGQSGVKTSCRFLKSPAAQEACDHLTKVLGTSPLLLTELDLSEDKLRDPEWEKLSALLIDSHSKVEKMKLNNCKLTEKSCSVLATVLSSKTILKEMNLNNSRLLDSGVKEICEGLKNPVCELEILKLKNGSITEEGCAALISAFNSNPSNLIELDLSGNKLGCLGMEKICLLLKNPQCKFEKLKLNNCKRTEKSCQVLATVLSSKTILKEMNLNNSHLLDSGVKEICEGLKNPVCELKILNLRKCGLTEKSCSALATVLRSNSSLKELDMSNNNLQDSGVKKLQTGLENTNCTLKKLRFLSSAAEKACQYVPGIMGSNPLFMRELNLSGHKLDITFVNYLAAVLEDKHCQFNKLQ